MNLIVAKPVNKGDVAYIISPSAGIMPFAQQRVERAIANLSKFGLEVKIADNASGNSGYVSADIEERVADIHEAFADSRCSLIVASIGGNHSNQLIGKLDYDLIRKNPKTFVGYSDNTVLHLSMLSQAGLQTFYGPCFMNQFGEYPDLMEYTSKSFKKIAIKKDYQQTVLQSEYSTDEILDWFKGDDATRPRKMNITSEWSWWRNGESTGWSLPAAIPSINHIVGTKYMPETEGAILMIDIPEGNSMHEGMSIAEVDSWVTDLLNAGLLDKISGLIIGRPYKYTNEMISQLKSVVLRITDGTKFPIVFNFDFGHTDPMLTIPYGCKLELNSAKKTIKFS